MPGKYNRILKLIKSFTIIELAGLMVVAAGLFWLVSRTKPATKWRTVVAKASSPYIWQTTQPPFYWLGDYLREGAEEYDENGRKIAVVKKIQVYPLVTLQNQEAARDDIYLRVELADSSPDPHKIIFKNKKVAIGEAIEFSFGGVDFSGIVVDISDVPIARGETRELVMEGVWLRCHPWIAEAIAVGDKMLDFSGEPVVEVTDKRVELAKVSVESASGAIVVSTDPLRRDLYLRLKVKARQKDGQYFLFYDKRIKVGEQLFIPLEKADIKWLWVTKFYPAQKED